MTNQQPEHPELYYRLTGEWKGWKDFLGPQCQDPPDTDKLEEQAFELLKKDSRFTGKYDEKIIRLWKELSENF